MFEDMTFEMVLERMLDRVDASCDKRESSPIYAALAPAALEIVNICAALDDCMEESFADTASRPYLKRLAAIRGLSPRPAVHAVVLAEFTPDTVEVLPGTLFTSEKGAYRVTEKAADGIYRLRCEEAGEAGNAYLGEIIPADYIPGLEAAVITDIFIYGEEEEDTEAFRQRYLNSFQANAFGGNLADYKNKALSMEGVGAVKVVPVWKGPGTVRLVILDTKCRRAPQGLVEKIQNLFDPKRDGRGSGLAPIGHIVTVDTAEEITVRVTAKLTYDTGYDWNICKEAIEAALEAYFLEAQKAWSGQDVSILRINAVNAAIVSIQGVIDVQETTLNGTGENLTLGSYEIPVFGGMEHV